MALNNALGKNLEECVLFSQLKDARAREEWFKERSLSIDKMREAEKNAQNSTHNKVNKKLWVSPRCHLSKMSFVSKGISVYLFKADNQPLQWYYSIYAKLSSV